MNHLNAFLELGGARGDGMGGGEEGGGRYTESLAPETLTAGADKA